MKLYGLEVAVDTARVMATLEEMGVEYHLIPINPEAGETKLPTYLSINPFGQIPALQDAHITLFGSRAISKYIARKHKRMSKDLIRESNQEEEAMVEVWMEVEAEQYEPAISALINYVIEVGYYGKVEDEQVMAKKVGDLEKVLDVYEERLEKSKYLAGDFFSLADLHHLPQTHRLMASPRCALLINSRPKVRAWWEDLSCRPACKKVTETMDACAIAWKEKKKKKNES
ncbi:Glutathione transferase protein [Dioscorea alata]|uniref:Glutathione transferase protein n=1 Tax=Dioscorea alata TaxID=55571 RepID=A0ACB7U3X5_DIOAL|nr:Glutathione transferase protein [Dioscorea alata]